jgi:protein TonB
MASFFSASPPGDTLEIVFAHRNRAYGAYHLRRSYTRYLARALAFGLLLIGFGVALPYLLDAMGGKYEKVEFVSTILEPTLRDIDPDQPPPTPPPPPPTPPPPVRATLRFVPPKPVPDEQVRDEQPPAQEDVLNDKAEVGTVNRDGAGDAPPSIDTPTDIPGIVESAPPPPEETYNMVTVQKPPTFPGGDQDLLRYLAENIRYPPLAREANVQGTVVLAFVVGKDGSINDVQVLKDIGAGCGKEAVRVVQGMPKWTPGEANGHPVKVRFTLPVRYRLE